MDSSIARTSSLPGGPATRLEFVAFTRQPVGDGMPSAGPHPTYYLTLLEQRLRIALDPGPFTLPLGFVAGDRIGGGFPPDVGGQRASQLFTGTALYQYRLGLPANASVERITVTTQQWAASDVPTSPSMPYRPPSAPPPTPETPPGPAAADTFFIYEWVAERWEPLPEGREASTVEAAGPYVGPEGIVEVEVRTTPGRMLYFARPQIAVEGTAR
jgi:hypothetical protein